MKIRPTVRPASKGADEGWAVLSTLISGFVVFGGIGWLLDQWWGTRLMTPIGLVVGMALGIYAVVMQFGRPRTTDQRRSSTHRRSRRNAGSAGSATDGSTGTEGGKGSEQGKRASEHAVESSSTSITRTFTQRWATSGQHPKGDRVSLNLLSQVLLAAEEGGEFEAPSVEHSFFFDRIGDGTVIASVKAMVLLVLGHPDHHGLHDRRRPGRRRCCRANSSSPAKEFTASSATGSRSRFSAARTAANGPVSWPPCSSSS